MRLMLLEDILLGSMNSEKLDVKQLKKWQNYRLDKLNEIVDQVVPEEKYYIVIIGKLFGIERVPEAIIDDFFRIVISQKHISFLAFLSQKEYSRISYRNDIPQNLQLVCIDISDSYKDEGVCFKAVEREVQIQLGKNPPIILMNDKDGYYISAFKTNKVKIPRFEATGYEDANEKFGYALIEWNNDIGKYKEIENNKFSYHTIDMKISPEDNQKELMRKLLSNVSKFKYETFLRVNLIGKTAFGLVINKDEIVSQLKSRLFFVEVYDNTRMDIDENDFANDISLRSEFVRLALQDDSLSEGERNGILSYGWNVLNGKEVSEE